MEFITRWQRWFTYLEDPATAFKQIEKRSFEAILEDYLKLLILNAVLVALFVLVVSVVKAVYFNLFLVVDIEWWRLINYAFGRSTALLFFYLFSGTFGLFIVSLLVAPFTKAKYVRVLSLLFISLTPVLLFGWLYPFTPGLLFWSFLLLLIALRSQRHAKRVKRTSLQQRD